MSAPAERLAGGRLPQPANLTAYRPLVFPYDARMSADDLADLADLADLWESCPPLALPPLVARVFYSLEYTALYRPFVRNGVWQQQAELRERLYHIAVAAFPTPWLPLAALDGIQTRTYPDRLASVLAGWETTRRLPVFLMDNGQGLELLNGNHRLTGARSKGAASIYATIMPYCQEYIAARDREEAVIAEIRALDSIPIWVDQDNNLRNSLL